MFSEDNGVATDRAPDSLALDSGLFLRWLTLGDAPAVYAAVDACRAHLGRWLPWVENANDIGETIQFIEETERQRRQGLSVVYGIWSEEEFCGTIGMHHIDEKNLNLQIGYWLKEGAQGKGLAFQACATLLGVAFELMAMERVEIRVAVGNERSEAVARRLGFREEGLLRRSQRLLGEFVDLKVYSLLAEEFRQIAGISEQV
jgi:ribosomal-protein-serine acetyltransferase